MTPSEQTGWTTYYNARSGRPPRPLLVDAMMRFSADAHNQVRHAIDLGCGEGTDTLALLDQGWQVLAIDQEPEAIARLLAKIAVAQQAQLQTAVAAFADLTLPRADLIYAGYSLPFCQPVHFPALWRQIEQALPPGGRFAGQLFGERDEWADDTAMTFFTATQALALFTGFALEHFREIEEDGQAVSGPKHWHLFEIIARKEETDDTRPPFPHMV